MKTDKFRSNISTFFANKYNGFFSVKTLDRYRRNINVAKHFFEKKIIILFSDSRMIFPTVFILFCSIYWAYYTYTEDSTDTV